MSGARRSVLEKKIQRAIEADLGAEPDLLLLKNSVGQAEYFNDAGEQYFVPYGLGVGSPDLVGLLRVEVLRPSRKGDTILQTALIRTVGIWFCLEVKPSEVAEPDEHQKKCHAIWRRFGAFIDTVHSVEEARAALERARRLEF